MRKFLAGRIALIIFGGATVVGVVAAKNQTVHGTQAEHAFADLAKVLDGIGEKPNGFRGGEEAPCQIVGENLDTCLIHVNIIQTYKTMAGGAPYGCILKVNNVSINSAAVKKIQWKLFILKSDTDPESAGTPVTSQTVPPYIFYKKFEILIVKDDEKQVQDRTSNTDGTVLAPYSYKAHRKIKYYPVVVQNPDPDEGTEKGNEVLCGSLDPKIVNN